MPCHQWFFSKPCHVTLRLRVNLTTQRSHTNTSTVHQQLTKTSQPHTNIPHGVPSVRQTSSWEVPIPNSFVQALLKQPRAPHPTTSHHFNDHHARKIPLVQHTTIQLKLKAQDRDHVRRIFACAAARRQAAREATRGGSRQCMRSAKGYMFVFAAGKRVRQDRAMRGVRGEEGAVWAGRSVSICIY